CPGGAPARLLSPGRRHASLLQASMKMKARCIAAIVIALAGACKGTGRGDTERVPASASPAAPAESSAVRARDAEAPGAEERIVITQVIVETMDPPDGPARELYPRELAKALGRQLTESGLFLSSEMGRPPGIRARSATVEALIGYQVRAGRKPARGALLAAI